MTDIGVAGEIGVASFVWMTELGKWLKDNPDREIIDIKLSGTDTSYIILVIYRKDS